MDKKMHCPRCSTVFKKRVMKKLNHPSGAILDVCDHCGGMWLDRNEVKLLYNFSKKSSKVKK
ncbi:MAG: zf-TFIIB domain-containing protein [Nanoarchaeota archaeon]